jgi:hypothetical protein
MKYCLIIVSFLFAKSTLAQIDTSLYHQDCLSVKKNVSKKKDALDVGADKFLEKGQIFVYFHLQKSDTLNVLINDSLIQRKYVNVLLDRTGDSPDFSIKLNIKNKASILTVYFERDKSFFRIKIDKRYRVYGVVYHTGGWENCIYIEKKKYFRFS